MEYTHRGTYLEQSIRYALRIDNSGWSVNSSALFDVAGMRWYQRKYHVLYTIRQPIINSIISIDIFNDKINKMVAVEIC